ncbi:glycosyl transferase family 2 [Pseudofrankia inefficax]|uniref:4,4'-diaponeurosporenoate glycosyltransferase n=1 Tax=Pseudofrankia inefficax (strain DSM 45817 / CECT 9037 / DDB 130130 / EuI1c) TaxID=298654 RepID=E3J8H6_PSEI1|nr:glycosyl transferase family 2 [Pseudofrankia inefficax]
MRRIGVAVPAHNEQDLLPACLGGLIVAAIATPVPVEIVVVLDACTDETGLVVRSAARTAAVLAAAGRARPPRVRSISVTGRNVGLARAAGLREILAGWPDDLAGTWLATTDADSVVPPGWLTWQCALAARGADAVVGEIKVVDWSEHSPDLPGVFARHYHRRPGHPHVHGANLGVTALAYQRAGGYPPLAVAEDHGLVDALVATGHRVLRTRGPRVVTSARRDARAAGGFGDTLRTLVP